MVEEVQAREGAFNQGEGVGGDAAAADAECGLGEVVLDGDGAMEVLLCGEGVEVGVPHLTVTGGVPALAFVVVAGGAAWHEVARVCHIGGKFGFWQKMVECAHLVDFAERAEVVAAVVVAADYAFAQFAEGGGVVGVEFLKVVACCAVGRACGEVLQRVGVEGLVES